MMKTKTVEELIYSIQMIMIVTRREVKDTMRDWRLIFPIAGLTLLFPGLMTIVAGWLADLVETYNSNLVGERTLPILLLVVGFFPTSFSLVIALEAFVGEKERKSLEPLLATPLTDRQLFIGKLLAAVLPPVMASYVGIAAYALGVTILVGPLSPQSIMLVVVITTVQAFLMVSASVIISSQTTSTRAANMLASFIIVPVSVLLQGEALLLIFENYFAVWWIIFFIFIVTLIFIRIGIQIFNRENLLGRQIDFFNIRWVPRYFARRFVARSSTKSSGNPVASWYRHTFSLIGDLKLPIFMLLMMLAIAIVAGAVAANLYQLPEEFLSRLRSNEARASISVMQQMFADLPLFIFSHNMRAILLLVILGSLTFGVSSILIYMLPWTIIAFIAAQFALIGENPLVFISATVLPHAWVELPIFLLVTAAALRWQASVIAPTGRKPLAELWVQHAADFSRIMIGFGVPLFAVAALLESFLTPMVIVWVYG